MARNIRTIGLLRFTVLTPTYYHQTFKTLDKIAEHIFNPERLALRFHIFENLCLPSMVRQSDPEFDLVILTAETLPVEAMARLADLTAPYANIHLRPVSTDNHYQLIKGGYDAFTPQDCTHRIMFRLDDDDALDLEFIARTKARAAGLMAMQDPDEPTLIAYNRGFYVSRSEDGNEVFDAVERAPLSAGSTLVAPVSHPTNPYRYVHRKYAQHYTTYSDISVPAFIRTIHGDNKSTPTQMGITHKMRNKPMDAALRSGFGTTLRALKAL